MSSPTGTNTQPSGVSPNPFSLFSSCRPKRVSQNSSCWERKRSCSLGAICAHGRSEVSGMGRANESPDVAKWRLRLPMLTSIGPVGMAWRNGSSSAIRTPPTRTQTRLRFRNYRFLNNGFAQSIPHIPKSQNYHCACRRRVLPPTTQMFRVMRGLVDARRNTAPQWRLSCVSCLFPQIVPERKCHVSPTCDPIWLQGTSLTRCGSGGQRASETIARLATAWCSCPSMRNTNEAGNWRREEIQLEGTTGWKHHRAVREHFPPSGNH